VPIDLLIVDPAKAKWLLGWEAKTTFAIMVPPTWRGRCIWGMTWGSRGLFGGLDPPYVEMVGGGRRTSRNEGWL